MTTRTTSEAKLLAKAALIVDAAVDITLLIDGHAWHTDRFIGRCINWLGLQVADFQHELIVRKRGLFWAVNWRDGSCVDSRLHIALAKAVIAVSKEEKSHA